LQRAVLDTNVFLSAFIKPEGLPGQILRAFLTTPRAFHLVLSPDILEELRCSLTYAPVKKCLGCAQNDLECILSSIALLGTTTNLQELSYHVSKDDPDDDKYIAAAISGRAHYIVSGDKHLLNVKEYEVIQIISPKKFFRKL
jgi:uncharacterized protein